MVSSTTSEISNKDHTCEDYTIGWICVHVKQQTAAIMMLDERHPDIDKKSNDPITYTLGSMGLHNVVIGCLPLDWGGSDAAATIAVWMTNTFPCIKLCLIVGLGSGIPNKVRLGDVVVGIPHNGSASVVEGQMDGSKGCKRAAEMGHPPSILLSALTKLKTIHEIEGSRVPEYLSKIKENKRLAQIYLVSDMLRDPLFGRDGPEMTDKLKSELGKTEPIRNATPELEDPEIHYGLIASTSRPIRDQAAYERLDSTFGGRLPLCVETEASGLMCNFPALVIRGISEYTGEWHDDYKDWQGPAAAVAAAYGKEVLSVLPRAEVERVPTIQSLGPSVF